MGSDSEMNGVDVEQRHPLAVDRDLDLLASRRHAVEEAGGARVEVDLEDVLAIGWEVVDERDPAARTKRRTLDALHLRGSLRGFVRRLAGAGVWIADRQAADLAGRTQVAVHQRRRKGLDVRDVVEAVAHGVRRQNAATSTSIPSKSRIERAYSARLSRWNVRLPGFGLAAAASSIGASRAAMRAS